MRLCLCFLFLMVRRPPRSTLTDTLFPDTTLFRSLPILLENMRREGYELAVSRPRVVLKEIDGVKCEPFEMLTVDIEDTNQGAVMEALGARRGEDRKSTRLNSSH